MVTGPWMFSSSVLEIERIARMALGDDEQILRVGADFFDGRHRRLHRERQHFLRQIVESAGKEIGVDGRELEPRVAQIDRAVKRRRVLLPFEPEPPLDSRHGLENFPLEVEQRAT